MGKRLCSPTHVPTLQNWKSIHWAHQRQDLAKKEEEYLTKKEEEEEEDNKIFPPRNTKKCVVIMEGDPKPGALSGRMSFQNFNPYIEKLNEEAEFNYKHRLSTTSTAPKNGMNIVTEYEASRYENDGSNKNCENDTSGKYFPIKKTKVEISAGRWYLSPRSAVGADSRNQSSTDRGRKATQHERDGSNRNSENEPSGEDFHRKKLKVEIDSEPAYISPRNAVGADSGNRSSTNRGRKTPQRERRKQDWRFQRSATRQTKRR